MSITIDLPDEMTQRITASADRAGMTPSEYIADSVRRRLAIEEFHEMRNQLAPFSKAAGLDTDEAVFASIS